MADFPTDKYRVVNTATTEALRVADVLTIANLEVILHKQEALEYIQEAIAACTIPSVKPTLAQIDTAIAAEMVP